MDLPKKTNKTPKTQKWEGEFHPQWGRYFQSYCIRFSFHFTDHSILRVNFHLLSLTFSVGPTLSSLLGIASYRHVPGVPLPCSLSPWWYLTILDISGFTYMLYLWLIVHLLLLEYNFHKGRGLCFSYSSIPSTSNSASTQWKSMSICCIDEWILPIFYVHVFSCPFFFNSVFSFS